MTSRQQRSPSEFTHASQGFHSQNAGDHASAPSSGGGDGWMRSKSRGEVAMEKMRKASATVSPKSSEEERSNSDRQVHRGTRQEEKSRDACDDDKRVSMTSAEEEPERGARAAVAESDDKSTAATGRTTTFVVNHRSRRHKLSSVDDSPGAAPYKAASSVDAAEMKMIVLENTCDQLIASTIAATTKEKDNNKHIQQADNKKYNHQANSDKFDQQAFTNKHIQLADSNRYNQQTDQSKYNQQAYSDKLNQQADYNKYNQQTDNNKRKQQAYSDKNNKQADNNKYSQHQHDLTMIDILEPSLKDAIEGLVRPLQVSTSVDLKTGADLSSPPEEASPREEETRSSMTSSASTREGGDDVFYDAASSRAVSPTTSDADNGSNQDGVDEEQQMLDELAMVVSTAEQEEDQESVARVQPRDSSSTSRSSDYATASDDERAAHVPDEKKEERGGEKKAVETREGDEEAGAAAVERAQAAAAADNATATTAAPEQQQQQEEEPTAAQQRETMPSLQASEWKRLSVAERRRRLARVVRKYRELESDASDGDDVISDGSSDCSSVDEDWLNDGIDTDDSCISSIDSRNKFNGTSKTRNGKATKQLQPKPVVVISNKTQREPVAEKPKIVIAKPKVSAAPKPAARKLETAPVAVAAEKPNVARSCDDVTKNGDGDDDGIVTSETPKVNSILSMWERRRGGGFNAFDANSDADTFDASTKGRLKGAKALFESMTTLSSITSTMRRSAKPSGGAASAPSRDVSQTLPRSFMSGGGRNKKRAALGGVFAASKEAEKPAPVAAFKEELERTSVNATKEVEKPALPAPKQAERPAPVAAPKEEVQKAAPSRVEVEKPVPEEDVAPKEEKKEVVVVSDEQKKTQDSSQRTTAPVKPAPEEQEGAKPSASTPQPSPRLLSAPKEPAVVTPNENFEKTEEEKASQIQQEDEEHPKLDESSKQESSVPDSEELKQQQEESDPEAVGSSKSDEPPAQASEDRTEPEGSPSPELVEAPPVIKMRLADYESSRKLARKQRRSDVTLDDDDEDDAYSGNFTDEDLSDVSSLSSTPTDALLLDDDDDDDVISLGDDDV